MAGQRAIASWDALQGAMALENKQKLNETINVVEPKGVQGREDRSCGLSVRDGERVEMEN